MQYLSLLRALPPAFVQSLAPFIFGLARAMLGFSRSPFGPWLPYWQAISIDKLRSDWNLDVFAFSPPEQLQIAALIFEDTGSLSKFNIPADQLSR